MKKNKPNIVVCNDDGVNAPGIRALWECLSDIANLTVVAPAKDQSCIGAGFSAPKSRVIEAEPVIWDNGIEVWQVHGTPSDSAKFALNFLHKGKPDLLVSGINNGSNAGCNVLYSGTIGACVQGVFSGVPGVAFSCMWEDGPEKYEMAKQYIPTIVEHALEHRPPKGTLFNVNFPSYGAEGVTGIKMAKQGRGYWDLKVGKDPSLKGTKKYPLLEVNDPMEEPEDSDIRLLTEGHITCVPIHIHDMTDHHLFQNHKLTFESLNKRFSFPSSEPS